MISSKLPLRFPWSAIPIRCRAVLYFDGAVSDPVPVKRALERGCGKVVLILTKPADTVRSPERDRKLAGMLKRKYPKIAEGLSLRAERYNQGVALARQLEREGRALIIAPETTDGADTLTRDKEILDRFYPEGPTGTEDGSGNLYNVPEAAASAGAGKERKSMKYFVGIDLGTSSVKSLLMREDGWVAGTAQRAYDIVRSDPTGRNRTWKLLWNAARETLQELMGKNPEAEKPGGRNRIFRSDARAGGAG